MFHTENTEEHMIKKVFSIYKFKVMIKNRRLLVNRLILSNIISNEHQLQVVYISNPLSPRFLARLFGNYISL